MDKDKEIELLKDTVKAQATMILHYKIGKTTMPGWVFIVLDKARKVYGGNLHKID